MIINQPIYNGDLIHKRFAYQFFKKNVSPCGDIVAFRAPMYVSDNLIDLEDSLSKDYIFSDDAINFCWEIPNLCPIGAVAFQRLFNAAIANILAMIIKKPLEMKGDDIMVHDTFIGGKDKKQYEVGKVSVSITYSKDNVAIGHTGININAGNKAPGFAYSSKLNDDQVQELMYRAINYFNEEIKDMQIATTKVIV
jgi:hypothetical protein